NNLEEQTPEEVASVSRGGPFLPPEADPEVLTGTTSNLEEQNTFGHVINPFAPFPFPVPGAAPAAAGEVDHSDKATSADNSNIEAPTTSKSKEQVNDSEVVFLENKEQEKVAKNSAPPRAESEIRNNLGELYWEGKRRPQPPFLQVGDREQRTTSLLQHSTVLIGSGASAVPRRIPPPGLTEDDLSSIDGRHAAIERAIQ
ncbi:unnamed protein product, partial [Amoebophrya sp. A120]